MVSPNSQPTGMGERTDGRRVGSSCELYFEPDRFPIMRHILLLPLLSLPAAGGGKGALKGARYKH